MKKHPKPLIDEDGEVREITAADMKKFRPARNADQAFVAKWKRSRGRPEGRTKQPVTISLDKDILAALRASGSGWQTRVNDLLKAAVVMRA